MIKKEHVFKIGQFAKPHGIKGEIALVTNSDVFDNSEDPYILCEMDGILVPFFIEEYRYKTDTVILLKLKNVDDEKAAREFSNREVFYSLDEVDEGDLVGDNTWHKSKDEQIRNHSGIGFGLNTNSLFSTREHWKKYGRSGCHSFQRLPCWACLPFC